MPETPPRLLLLDGHSLAYRAFFALPVENFSTVTGQHTNAVYGFTSMLVNVLRDEQPTHVGVAFDKSRQTFRLQEYADYKAGRNKTPSEFSSQLPLIQAVLDALRIPHLSLEGYEADDIIATLATDAANSGLDVLILTGDRDSLQLVTETCTVLYPMRGVSELARMTPEAVEAKYGVPPARYPELAALVGETSDNLPGVPGVGQGYAAKWINQYDGLDNVIEHADEITGKKGEALRAHLADVMRNRRLNALVTDLDLDLAPADFAMKTWDRQAGLRLLDELEFRGDLRTRLLEVIDPDPADEIDESGFDLAGHRLAPGEVQAWLAAHAAGEARTGVAVRGSWRGGTGEVWSLALAAADGTAAWLDAAEVTPEDDAALVAWFADPGRAKVLHDAKGPMLALSARGWELRGLVSDTALAAYLVQPDQRSYDLADLTLRYLKRELRTASEDDGQGELSFDDDRVDRRPGSRDAPRAGGARPRRGPRRSHRPARRGPAAGRDGAPARRPAGPARADRRRRRHRPPRVAREPLRRRGGAGGGGRVRRDRQGDQPRLAEAAAGRAVRRARHAEDQAHQDRLDDRRRCPPVALREDRAPLPDGAAAPSRRLPAPADDRGAPQDGRARRPDPHHVQPDDRRDRPALEHRPQPPEHPDPHRGGAPDPGGLRGRRRASSA